MSRNQIPRVSPTDLEEIGAAINRTALVVRMNPLGVVTHVNDRFCDVFRYSRAEAIGLDIRSLSQENESDTWTTAAKTAAGGDIWRGELSARTKDGSSLWLDTTVTGVFDDEGGLSQLIAIQDDITPRRKLEADREQESMAQLGKMAAMVAHEVRNPLAGIRGALQIIGGRLDAASREAAIAGEIIARIDTLSQIVHDLLQFARPHALVFNDLAVSEIIEGAVSTLHADPRFGHVETEVDLEPLTIKGDREQLILALRSVLINGAQASPPGGRVRISARAGTGALELHVSDDGPGVAEEARAHLFEPFYTTRHQGVGLGLVTARRILTAHGGSVTLEFPAAGGTVAVIRVPLSGQISQPAS